MLLRWARPKIIIVLFAIVVLFNVAIFPMLLPTGAIILDVRFSYSVEEVRKLFETLRWEGMVRYLLSVSIADMIYPMFYGLFLLLSILALVKKYFHDKSRLFYLGWLPLLLVVADISENVAILLMMQGYPDLSFDLVKWGSFFMSLKWTLVGINLTVLAALPLLVRFPALRGRE